MLVVVDICLWLDIVMLVLIDCYCLSVEVAVAVGYDVEYFDFFDDVFAVCVVFVVRIA